MSIRITLKVNTTILLKKIFFFLNIGCFMFYNHQNDKYIIFFVAFKRFACLERSRTKPSKQIDTQTYKLDD